MLYKVMVFTVNGHKELRTHKIVHELKLLAAAMPRDVDALIASVDDICTELHQIVHRLRNELLISRNRCCRDDDRISRHDRNFSVIRGRHARQR